MEVDVSVALVVLIQTQAIADVVAVAGVSTAMVACGCDADFLPPCLGTLDLFF